jgi:predicted RNA-binding protein
MDRLAPRRDEIHKVTISGMYGPVPEEKETEDPVMEYEYVLAEEDTEQIEVVRDRIIEFLQAHGDSYDNILAYAVSKTYRGVIESAFNAYGEGTLYPRDPEALRLTEHFRRENIKELIEHLGLEMEPSSGEG